MRHALLHLPRSGNGIDLARGAAASFGKASGGGVDQYLAIGRRFAKRVADPFDCQRLVRPPKDCGAHRSACRAMGGIDFADRRVAAQRLTPADMDRLAGDEGRLFARRPLNSSICGDSVDFAGSNRARNPRHVIFGVHGYSPHG
jgi:hypothetical protein